MGFEPGDMIRGWKGVGEAREKVLEESGFGIGDASHREVCPWLWSAGWPSLPHLYNTTELDTRLVVDPLPVVLSENRAIFFQENAEMLLVFSSGRPGHVLMGGSGVKPASFMSVVVTQAFEGSTDFKGGDGIVGKVRMDRPCIWVEHRGEIDIGERMDLGKIDFCLPPFVYEGANVVHRRGSTTDNVDKDWREDTVLEGELEVIKEV